MKKRVIEKSKKNYPDEFLFARLRSRLSENYPAKGFREIVWVHSVMNSKLFLTFYPFFVIIHLNKIVALLRYKFFQKEKRKTEEIFKETLFAREFKEFAIKIDSLEQIKLEATQFDIFLKFDFKKFQNIMENIGEVEDRLLAHIFFRLLKNTKQKAIKNFVSSYIDYINIKQVYKALKWHLEDIFLIDGGLCDKIIFLKIIDNSDETAFYDFLDGYFKEGFKELDIEILDILLIEKMLNEMKKYILDNNIGFLLYYLFYCHYLEITG